MLIKAIVLSAACLLTTMSQGTESMTYQIEVKELPAQPALVVKGRIKIENARQAIGGNIGTVGKFLGSRHLSPAGGPFTRTYNFENGVLEFESGFPITGDVKGEGEVVATELPKGTVAVTTHVGDQATSENAYKAIHIWMKKNGKTAAGAPWEVYLTDPESTPENEARTQIFFPIL